ncbi:hypothetical protein ACFL2G_05300 [Candidatus Omnitrophota bacterium]
MPVYKRENNYYIDCYASPTRRIRKKIGESKRVADRVLEKIKTEIIEEKYFDIKRPKKIKLKDFSEKFISSYCKVNKLSWRNDELYHVCFIKIN